LANFEDVNSQEAINEASQITSGRALTTLKENQQLDVEDSAN